MNVIYLDSPENEYKCVREKKQRNREIWKRYVKREKKTTRATPKRYVKKEKRPEEPGNQRNRTEPGNQSSVKNGSQDYSEKIGGTEHPLGGERGAPSGRGIYNFYRIELKSSPR
jgi:hypothetical protein